MSKQFAQCRLFGHEIRFFACTPRSEKSPADASPDDILEFSGHDLDGECHWRRGKLTILVNENWLEDCHNPRALRAIIHHELTHAIEYLNDPAYLSAKAKGGCTPLAQTMEAAWDEIRATFRIFKWIAPAWEKAYGKSKKLKGSKRL